MAVKCIAIGNRIMGDDAVGLKVAEELLEKLSQINVEVIFGETDTDYALSRIGDGDFLFILDSTYLDTTPGTVTFAPIEEMYGGQSQVYSQHQPSLIHLLKTYQKSVEGFVIGIEVEQIDFSLELSNTLIKKLPTICGEVYQLINHTIRGIYHA